MTGIPGSGKSTWIKENSLEEYALSFDKLRIASGSQKYTAKELPTYDPNLKEYQTRYFLDTLKDRFKSGAFTIIDNTNLSVSSYQELIKMSKSYDYSLYYKAFEVTPEEAYKRILSRGTNHVPLDTLLRMQDSLSNLVIPSVFTKIDSLQDIEDVRVYNKTYQFSSDKNVYLIGDIHGCLETLEEFISKYYNSNDFFIFGGDYIDRGPDSKGVINTLKGLYYNHNNCIFLEGNHEKWLRYYSNDILGEINSPEFKENTLKQFLRPPVLKRGSLKNFCRALKPFADITIEGKRILFSHGGSNYSKNKDSSYNLKNINSYTSGSGGYSDLLDLYEEGSPDYDIVVHGHRNISNTTVYKSQDGKTTYYNLEGKIERGGSLRFLKIKGDSFEMGSISSNYNMDLDVSRVVQAMRDNKHLISERPTSFLDISSFNFNKEAFYSKQWKSVVCKARGLFINTVSNQVVGRGYEKFFNYGENEFTSKESLEDKFPFTAYSKENGFLGLIYSHPSGSLSFNTKSGDLTDYSKLFKNNFIKSVDQMGISKLSNLLSSRNLSLAVEVIDYSNDPHLTYYDDPYKICILDLIPNSISFGYLPYEELKDLTSFLLEYPNFSIKKVLGEIKTPEELVSYSKSLKKDLSEGVVLRNESSRFMFKIKTKSYQIKKTLREYHQSKNRTSLFRTLKRILDFKEFNTLDYVPLLKIVDSKENFSDINLKELDKEILLLL